MCGSFLRGMKVIVDFFDTETRESFVHRSPLFLHSTHSVLFSGYIFGLTPSEVWAIALECILGFHFISSVFYSHYWLLMMVLQVWVRQDYYNSTKHRISIAHLASGKCAIRFATNRDP